MQRSENLFTEGAGVPSDALEEASVLQVCQDLYHIGLPIQRKLHRERGAIQLQEFSKIQYDSCTTISVYRAISTYLQICTVSAKYSKERACVGYCKKF